MVQGRGSTKMVASTVLLLSLLILHSQFSEAATYTVGGPSGWTFNVDGWPKGKTFKVGDVLVFNYSPSAHNVVSVIEGGYKTCSTSRGSKTYTTGKDQIKLVKGQNFFICSFTGHCQSGMKIAVTAT